MASPSPRHVLLVVAVSLSLFLYSPSPTEAATPYAPSPSPTAHSTPELVEHVCSQTDVYEFCMKALRSDRRTASAPDLLAIAKIALDLAAANATNVRKYIEGMVKRRNMIKPAALKAALEKCVSWYDAVFYSFRSSLAEVEIDAMTANYDAMVAGDYVLSCEKEVSSRGVSVPSISAKSEVMMHFVKIGSTVTDLLWT